MIDVTQPDRLAFLQGLEGDPDTRAPTEGWRVNNSSLEDYFGPVKLDGHPEGVLGIIQRQIGDTEGNAGIDIAGGTNGVALQELLKMGLLENALVTNYRNRPNWRARKAGIDYVRGNILLPKTWQKIIDWQEEQAPEGLALVMHRPDGGMQSLSTDFYEGVVHLLLDVVGPKGVMFTQVPQILRHRRPEELAAICEGVKTRPDVEEILVPKPPQNPKQAAVRMPKKDCVVIIKR